MVYLPVFFLAVAAVGGTVLVAMKHRGRKIPMALAVAHGIFTATGLAILAAYIITANSASQGYETSQRGMSTYVVFCNGGGRQHDSCGQEVPRQGDAGGSNNCTWYYCDGGADHSDYKCYHGHFKSGDGYFSNSVRGRGFGRVYRHVISYQEETESRDRDTQTQSGKIKFKTFDSPVVVNGI
jgi:hypothetical protein